MGQYIVFTKNGTCKGFIPSKEIYKEFKQQRDESGYNIVKVKEKDIKRIPLRGAYEVGEIHGVLMFPDEEEYFYESFNQLMIDFEWVIGRVIKDVLPVLKLNEEEYHKVYTFLKWCYDCVKCIDEDVDPGLVFNMTIMAKTIINDLGGCTI
ncbi:hypothetical protein D1872_36700 [compost metagenome]